MTNRTWIQEKLIELNYDTPKLQSLYKEFALEQSSLMAYNSYCRRISEVKAELEIDELEECDLSNEDLTTNLVKKSASTQKLRDSRNFEVKIKRENERLYNLLEDKFDAILDNFHKVDLKSLKLPPIKKTIENKYAVLQISDIHANEIILLEETHGLNEYDFTVLSKRLRKYIQESIFYFKKVKVTDVYIAFTGDFVNSSRRLSEKLAQSASVSKASLLLTYLLEQAIIDLRKQGFKLHVVNAVGNESRLSDHMESNEMTASENWDFLIFNSLRHLFRGVKNVDFIVPDNQITSVIELPNGFNFLITHGHTIKGDAEKGLGKLILNHSYKGLIIHMVLYGHYHSSSIGDFVCRCGSLCGGNSYSTSDLKLLSRASQNLYLINDNKSFTGVKIDLQDVSGVEGYNLAEELAAYTKASSKANLRITG
ncbi:MAG: hypothetical protein PF569_04930 [Candidatus Woesearchaeota archaeon]|nr:hypothetical protein [Candidatus Woesearchaeota archaeon]